MKALWSLLIPGLLLGGVPLRYSGSHVLVDGMYVNGHGPYTFLLDTGAQATTVSRRLARQAKLVPAYRVEVATVAGTFLAAAARTTLGAADTSADDVEVLVYDNPKAEGVLGQSFLSRFRHLIDLRQGVLDFEVDPPAGDSVPFRWVDGRPSISYGGLDLVLDSGAPALVLYRREPGFLPKGSALITSAGRSTQVEAGTWKNLPAVIVQQRASSDGLLPLRVFAWVYVDPFSGSVRLEPAAWSASAQPPR